MARRHLAAAVISALLLTACGTASPPAGTTAAEAVAGFPVSVTNCGITTTYDRPPRRAVALNQHSVETMLALGLQKSMVGTAFLDDQVLPEYRDAYEGIPVIAEEYPSYETLLAAEPDFVYGGWESAFDEKEGRGRERLRDVGIDTHLNPENCSSEPMTLSAVDDEIRTMGRIFGVSYRAEWVVERQQRSLQDTRQRARDLAPVDVAVYDSGEATVFTSGGQGIGNQIIESAGGRNLFADVPKVWADVSFEQFAERAPEVILIYDYGDQSVEQKKRFLQDNPLLQRVPAVRDQRFAVLPLSEITAGVRVGRAVKSLAEQLHPEQAR
ncbi:iron chelate uptake ABC transporter, solute-binding protein [Mycolicibacterium flavescens]|uniref:ABC transporter substrate-binding protein n=1 Tax=Mycobacterium neumannii TaxID=2048551 RepID=UPI000B93AEE1|nr:ABC transporter substrate-binding protein [Mycobacterium neumannii]VEG38533.1 iron chelate uptake ABC transporter, solute-binding protein [Mycolicibacterium flavescens]